MTAQSKPSASDAPSAAGRSPAGAKSPTGIRGLDDILHGGLPVGCTTMISGGPGTGKTVLGLEFLYHGACRGEPGLFVSFEETQAGLRTNAAAMGMDLAGLEEAEMLRINHAATPHRAVRAGEFDIQGLLAVLEGQLRSIGATRIVLDAVDVLMRLFGDPRREREEMYVLHDWLRDQGLTAILTVKSRPDEGQIYPFLDFMADCVLYLDQRIDGQVRTRRLSVVKYRGSGFLSNEHPFVFSPDGIVLMPVSSMSLVQRVSEDRVSSGHEGLDSILGGGYRRGSCVLVAGPSGAGKTTLASTFVRRACERGEKALYVGLEESRTALVAGMQSVGIDLRPALEAGTLRVITALPESRGVEQHLLWILDALDTFTPDCLVLDAISACRRMGSREAAFAFLVRVLTACKERGITCFYASQVRETDRLGQISGLGIESLVDTLIAVGYQRRAGGLRRSLLVVKSRGSRHSMKSHQMFITEEGIELQPAGGEEHDKPARGNG